MTNENNNNNNNDNTLESTVSKLYNESRRLATNLRAKGVHNITTNMGFHDLIDSVLLINPTLTGLSLTTSISCTTNKETMVYGETVQVSGVLSASYDDTGETNVDLTGYLQGATIRIYNNNTLIGTVITNSQGEYSYNYTTTTTGTLSLKAVFEGTNDYDNCTSSNVSVGVTHGLVLTGNKSILSYADEDSLVLTCTFSKGSGETVQVFDANDDSLIGTMTDNLDGTYNYTYNATGNGEIGFYAKSDNLTSRTYTIDDKILYKDKIILNNNVDWGNEVLTTLDSVFVDNVIFSAKVKPTTLPSYDSEFAIKIANKDYPPVDSSYNDVALAKYNTTANFTYRENNNHNIISQYNTDNSIQNHEYLMELIIKGTSLTGRITDLTTDTVLFEDDTTYSHTINPKKYAIAVWGNGSFIECEFNEITVEKLGTLELTANNQILSFADSTVQNPQTSTLTATLSKGKGKIVQLYDASNDNLIGTMSDNLDGTYSYTYTSSGSGDREFYAKNGNLVSETYSIEDCFKAQSSESSRTSTYTSDTAIPVFNDFNWTDDDFVVEFEAKYGGAGVGIGIEPSSYPLTMKQHITTGVNGTATYMMYWVGKETSGEQGYTMQGSTTLNTYIPMKIEKTGNTIKLYYNNVLKETLTITYLNGKTWTFIWSEWKSGTTYMFKNLKIKAL